MGLSSIPDFSPILVLRHEIFEHLGHFAGLLTSRGVHFTYHDLGDPLEIRDYRAILILGGPMSANDDLDGLKAELKLIGRALERGTPMLGICLGSQLIARALGARVYRNSALEIGWKPVHLTGIARQDPVFREIPSGATFFHWHGETFDLPAGADWLAWSDLCRQQAYRFGDRVYGIQFHPEITSAMIEDWSRQPVNCGDIAKVGQIDARAHDTREPARAILEGWLRAAGLF